MKGGNHEELYFEDMFQLTTFVKLYCYPPVVYRASLLSVWYGVCLCHQEYPWSLDNTNSSVILDQIRYTRVIQCQWNVSLGRYAGQNTSRVVSSARKRSRLQHGNNAVSTANTHTEMVTRLARIYSLIEGHYSVQIHTWTLTFLAFHKTSNISALLLLLVTPPLGKLELKNIQTSELGHLNSRARERGTLHYLSVINTVGSIWIFSLVATFVYSRACMLAQSHDWSCDTGYSCDLHGHMICTVSWFRSGMARGRV